MCDNTLPVLNNNTVDNEYIDDIEQLDFYLDDAIVFSKHYYQMLEDVMNKEGTRFVYNFHIKINVINMKPEIHDPSKREPVESTFFTYNQYICEILECDVVIPYPKATLDTRQAISEISHRLMQNLKLVIKLH